MSADVENMFSVKEIPWHNLGNVIQEAPSIEEGIKLAGLDWKVHMEPMFLADGRKAQSRAVIRDTDSSILGEVGRMYHPLQNEKAFEFFEPFVKSGEVKLETAGSLDDGKKIWVMAYLNRDPMEIAPGDIVRKFLLLANRHDGKESARVGFTPQRVVCSNTLHAAINATESSLLRVRHTANIEIGLEKVREMINLANQQFEATGEMYKAMVRCGVSEADLKKYVKQVFYPSVTDEEITQRQQTRLDGITNDIRRLFETGLGNDTKHVRGTMWALYNGVTEYLSHEANDDVDSRYNSLWFGTNKATNSRAMHEAVKMSVGGAA